jgi:hypothetical protein
MWLIPWFNEQENDGDGARHAQRCAPVGLGKRHAGTTPPAQGRTPAAGLQQQYGLRWQATKQEERRRRNVFMGCSISGLKKAEEN